MGAIKIDEVLNYKISHTDQWLMIVEKHLRQIFYRMIMLLVDNEEIVLEDSNQDRVLDEHYAQKFYTNMINKK